MKFAPLPEILPKECIKASKIREIETLSFEYLKAHLFTVQSFVEDGKGGLDGVRSHYYLRHSVDISTRSFQDMFLKRLEDLQFSV